MCIKNSAKFTRKHLCPAKTCNFIKKETPAQVFVCEFWEIFKNTFFKEHLRRTASEKKLNDFTWFLYVIFITYFKRWCLRPQACNFIKKETLTQVFSCEFCEISKNTLFTENLWWLLLMLVAMTIFCFFYKRPVWQTLDWENSIFISLVINK